jgi:hypothetical protein
MKNIKRLVLSTVFLFLIFSSNFSKADEGCWKKESGYNLYVNGFPICVLDNSSRDCFAMVNRCPVQ